MELGDRRPDRMKRNSTRNASCGVGGNESPSKPSLKKKSALAPRKPSLGVKKATPKTTVKTEPPKIKDAEPKQLSFDQKRKQKEQLNLNTAALKELNVFNQVVNDAAVLGIGLVDCVGGFSALDDISGMWKELHKLVLEKFDGQPHFWESRGEYMQRLPSGKWVPVSHQSRQSLVMHQKKHKRVDQMQIDSWAKQNLKAAKGAKVVRMSGKKRDVIIHPSSKFPGKVQLTFIEGGKPVGDANFDSITEAIEAASGRLIHDKPHAKAGDYRVTEIKKELTGEFYAV